MTESIPYETNLAPTKNAQVAEAYTGQSPINVSPSYPPFESQFHMVAMSMNMAVHAWSNATYPESVVLLSDDV